MSEYHSDLMGCCGLGGVSGLGEPEDEESCSCENCRESREEEVVVPTSKHSLVLATTIDGQNKGIAALEEKGYKRVLEWKNSNSGNTVTLWAQGKFRSLISDERRTKVATKPTKVTKKSKTPVRKTSKGL